MQRMGTTQPTRLGRHCRRLRQALYQAGPALSSLRSVLAATIERAVPRAVFHCVDDRWPALDKGQRPSQYITEDTIPAVFHHSTHIPFFPSFFSQTSIL